MEKLLLEFDHLFPDVPTRTDQIYPDVDVGNADPIKQHLYRLNPSKQKCLKEEIKYLLENDFIEPCQVTVVGVFPVYLFLNQMEVTECVPTIER